MKLNFKRQPKAPRNVKRAEMGELVAFLNHVLIINHNNLANDFYELREELATNGVVRDLRKLEREFAEFAEFKKHATAINKLNSEVFADKKASKYSLLEALAGVEQSQDVTLAGKVDAIIAHLGIDVSVKPKEVTPVQVVTTKVKTPAKKKGRR